MIEEHRITMGQYEKVWDHHLCVCEHEAFPDWNWDKLGVDPIFRPFWNNIGLHVKLQDFATQQKRLPCALVQPAACQNSEP